MTTDTRFLITIGIMASIAFGYRAAGLLIGTYLGESKKLRRFLDILPACAIGAVLGPSFGAMTVVQGLALILSAGVYLVTARFLMSLMIGVAVLMSEQWIDMVLARFAT